MNIDHSHWVLCILFRTYTNVTESGIQLWLFLLLKEATPQIA